MSNANASGGTASLRNALSVGQHTWGYLDVIPYTHNGTSDVRSDRKKSPAVEVVGVS